MLPFEKAKTAPRVRPSCPDDEAAHWKRRTSMPIASARKGESRPAAARTEGREQHPPQEGDARAAEHEREVIVDVLFASHADGQMPSHAVGSSVNESHWKTIDQLICANASSDGEIDAAQAHANQP